MEFLSFLESLRAPWLDAVMRVVTLLGSEALFLTLALFVFWCTDKRDGYYLLMTGFAGITLNMFLKITCRIPRPWVRNPSLTVVEGAKAGAGGYSFPSGHTQNITATLGVVAVTQRRRWVRILCPAVVLLVAFSRMYLGVHTPADVLTAMATSALLVLALYPVARWAGERWQRWLALLLGMLAVSVGYLLYALLWPFPAYTDAANLAEAQKHAWTLLGAVSAMCLCCWVDGRWLRSPTKAVWWAQLLKTVIGLALVLGVKEGLKPLMTLLFGAALFPSAIRYFCCVMVAALVWPMSFRFFARLGRH